jgi:hypothetical protein
LTGVPAVSDASALSGGQSSRTKVSELTHAVGGVLGLAINSGTCGTTGGKMYIINITGEDGNTGKCKAACSPVYPIHGHIRVCIRATKTCPQFVKHDN